MKKRHLFRAGCKYSPHPSIRFLGLLGLLAASMVLASCGRKAGAASTNPGAEPDKVLYEASMVEVNRGKLEVGRLGLQTLLNTYPDSEYLAKAKLGIADSYYKEGGTTGMTHAVAEYEDFITFFPFLDEAAYAQMQVGMAHYNRMEKPDRDRTETLSAENAFQVLLQKYPDGPIGEQGRQRLREVQEVLAEGEMRTAQYYFIRGADKSAVGRLQRLISRYPLYSKADRAQWDLATIYERHGGAAEISTQYYSRILKDYPLSPLAPAAKEKLTKYGVAIPDPDPEALARMKKEAEIERDRPGLFGRSMGMLKTGPDVTMAARVGDPTMTPSSEEAENTTILGFPAALGTAGGRTGVSAQTVTPGQK
jgi:outer membrane protein assembly factor BamD